MNFLLPYRLRRAVIGFACLLAAGPCLLAAEASDTAPPRTEPAPENLAPQRHPQNRLLLLEERLTRALKGLISRDALDPMPPRAPVPVVRRPIPAESDTDAKRDWMLMDPDSFAEHEASLELRKMLRDGGMLKDSSSPDAELYRDFNRSGSGTRGLVDSAMERELKLNAPGQKEDLKTPAAVARTEETLRNLLQDPQGLGLSSQTRSELSSRPSVLGQSSLSDSSGLSSLFQPPDTVQANRRGEEFSYVENYRKLMNPDPAPITDFASSPLGSLTTDPIRPGAPAPALGSFSKPRENNILGPQFGSINPVLSPRARPDTTEQVLNQWNKYYTPPAAPETPRTYAPPKPTFEAPRRAF